MTETTSCAYAGSSRSSRSSAAYANGRQRLVEREVRRPASAVSCTARRRPCGAVGSSTQGRSITPAARSDRYTAIARRTCRPWAPAGSWLSVSSFVIAATGSPVARPARCSTIACDTAKLLVSGSGGASRRRSNVLSVQLTCPSGAFLRTIFLSLLRVVAGLLQQLAVLDHVLRRQDDDLADGVEARPSGAPGDLVELARGQVPHADAVVLDQAGQQDRADGHVDADAERVRAADHRQQALLREALDHAPVLGQHPRVVHADAVPQQPVQRAPEARTEPEARDLVGDPVPLLAAGQGRRQQRLRPLDGLLLREVHDVDGGATGLAPARRAARAAARSRR